MKCNKCYGEYDEGAKFCPHCGERLTDAQSAPETGYAYTQPAEPTPQYEPPKYAAPPGYQTAQPAFSAPSGEMNNGLLVWSIINTAVCCQLLGIIALVMTILAKGASTAEEERSKLKTAKTLNLIGTIGGVLIVIFSIVFGIIVGLSESFYYW